MGQQYPASETMWASSVSDKECTAVGDGESANAVSGSQDGKTREAKSLTAPVPSPLDALEASTLR